MSSTNLSNLCARSAMNDAATLIFLFLQYYLLKCLVQEQH